jgi:hypothetical protein
LLDQNTLSYRIKLEKNIKSHLFGDGDRLGWFLPWLVRPTTPRPPEMGGAGGQALMRRRAVMLPGSWARG